MRGGQDRRGLTPSSTASCSMTCGCAFTPPPKHVDRGAAARRLVAFRAKSAIVGARDDGLSGREAMKHGSSLALAIARFPRSPSQPSPRRLRRRRRVTPMTPDVVASYDEDPPGGGLCEARWRWSTMRDGVKLYTVHRHEERARRTARSCCRAHPMTPRGSVSRTVSREDHRDPAGDGRRNTSRRRTAFARALHRGGSRDA